MLAVHLAEHGDIGTSSELIHDFEISSPFENSIKIKMLRDEQSLILEILVNDFQIVIELISYIRIIPIAVNVLQEPRDYHDAKKHRER